MKILVIMLRRIGDVILTTPAVSELREKFPEAKIDFLTEEPCNQILERNPDINEIIVYKKENRIKHMFDVRKRKYDWIIDFMGNPRSGIITMFSGAKLRAGPCGVFWKLWYNKIMSPYHNNEYACIQKIKAMDVLGVKFSGKYILPKFTPSETARKKVKPVIEKIKEGKKLVVAMAPASRRQTRAYPPQYYGKLAKMIAENHNAAIAVFWAGDELETAEKVRRSSDGAAIPFAKTETLDELGAALSYCDVLITNCNGPKHIAVAVGTPTFTIHSSSNPLIWTPHNLQRHGYIINENLPCIPCGKNECADMRCMTELTPEEVYKRVLPQLQ